MSTFHQEINQTNCQYISFKEFTESFFARDMLENKIGELVERKLKENFFGDEGWREI